MYIRVHSTLYIQSTLYLHCTLYLQNKLYIQSTLWLYCKYTVQNFLLMYKNDIGNILTLVQSTPSTNSRFYNIDSCTKYLNVQTVGTTCTKYLQAQYPILPLIPQLVACLNQSHSPSPLLRFLALRSQQ